MLLPIARMSFLVVMAIVAAGHRGGSLATPTRPTGVARFEPPQSIGTPLDDVARVYTGRGLADKIGGRLRLDTDPSLDTATRELIRRHLGS